MKLLFIFSAIVCFSAYAKDVKDLNKVLLQDVKSDIQNDDEKFRKPQMRKPASVEEANDQTITEPQKIDKNVRQIGPNAW